MYYRGKKPKNNFYVGVILNDMSEHYPCLFSLQNEKIKETTPKVIL